MGGGKSKAQEEQERRLAQLQQQQLAQQQQFITLASQPDPLTERLRARDTAFLDWADQKDAAGNAAPLDVRRAPGMGPSLGLYESARAGQQGERMGIGALRMGVEGSNPNLTSLLREQSQARREQEAAGGLERAVAVRNAEATGSVLPLAQLQQQQRLGLAGLASGNLNNTVGTLSQLTTQRRRPFWQDLLLSGFSGGAQAASMMGGGG